MINALLNILFKLDRKCLLGGKNSTDQFQAKRERVKLKNNPEIIKLQENHR